MHTTLYNILCVYIKLYMFALRCFLKIFFLNIIYGILIFYHIKTENPDQSCSLLVAGFREMLLNSLLVFGKVVVTVNAFHRSPTAGFRFVSQISAESLPVATLQHGKSRFFREKASPLVFDKAIERVSGNPTAGDEILVHNASGSAIGRGFFNPFSLYRYSCLFNIYFAHLNHFL